VPVGKTARHALAELRSTLRGHIANTEFGDSQRYAPRRGEAIPRDVAAMVREAGNGGLFPI
jgi:hypothetical protein